MVLTEIAAEQLEMGSEVPGESVRFSSDGRSLHILSFVWPAAAAGSRKDVHCPLPRPRKKNKPLRCWEVPATSRKSNSSALEAGISRTHPPVTPTRAVTSKSDVLLRQPPDLAEVLAKLAALLDEPRSSHSLESWQQRKRCTPRFSAAADQEGSRDQAAAKPRSVACDARDVGPGRSDDPSQRILELAATRKGTPSLTLRWVIVRVTGALVGRVGGFERQHATCTGCSSLQQRTFAQTVRLQTSIGRPPKLQQSSRGTGKRLRSRQQKSNTWSWQLLGLGARLDVPTVRQAIQVRQQGQRSKGAKAKEGGEKSDRVVIFITLALLVLVTVHGSSRHVKVGGPCFSCIDALFFRKTEFTKIFSEEIAAARSRHTSRRRRIPMPASLRRRARCNRHEARAGIAPVYRVVSHG